jgi:hypothetical protein
LKLYLGFAKVRTTCNLDLPELSANAEQLWVIAQTVEGNDGPTWLVLIFARHSASRSRVKGGTRLKHVDARLKGTDAASRVRARLYGSGPFIGCAALRSRSIGRPSTFCSGRYRRWVEVSTDTV